MNVTDGRLGRSFRRCLDWLLPPLCLGCRSSVADGIDDFHLCRRCRTGCREARTGRCPGCLIRIADRSAGSEFRCSACRRRPQSFDRAIAGWAYEPPLSAVVTGLKFGRLEFLGEALGRSLATLRRAELGEATSVVPVPLHRWRDLRRGYNQAERIASGVARTLSLPVVAALRRRRRTVPQTGLDRRDRRTNVRYAFAPRRRYQRDPRSLEAALGPCPVLVDDVFTTGATLDSAAAALRRSLPSRRGNREFAILALAAAYTPHTTLPR